MTEEKQGSFDVWQLDEIIHLALNDGFRIRYDSPFDQLCSMTNELMKSLEGAKMIGSGTYSRYQTMIDKLRGNPTVERG